MRMKSVRLVMGLLILVGLGDSSGSSIHAEPPKQQPKDSFMRGKLAASQQILEGLTTEDFQMVQKGSKELNSMTKAEKWRVSNDAMYKQFSQEFQRKTAALEKAAKAERIQDVSLKWVSVTMSCIECHSYVRGKRVAGNSVEDYFFRQKTEKGGE